MPSQYCENIYGGEVVIKEVTVNGGDYCFKEVKRLRSPHPWRRDRLHTLNEYKGEVIIDVGGYDYPFFVKCISMLSSCLKRKRQK